MIKNSGHNHPLKIQRSLLKLKENWSLDSFYQVSFSWGCCIPINLLYTHAWDTVVTSGLVPLVPTWNCYISYKNRYAGLSVLHLLPLLNPWLIVKNVARLSIFYMYYFGRCSSELPQLVPLPFSWRSSTRYSDRLHEFSVMIPKCYEDVYVNSFLPYTARPWNSLPKECFPLTYDLNGFKSRINWHLLTLASF